MAYSADEVALYDKLRADVHVTLAQMNDDQAAAIYAAATLKYPATSAAALEAATRVSVLQEQWATATDQADYTQNAESESLGQVAANKQKLLNYWLGLLKDALDDANDNVPGRTIQGSGTVKLRPVW